MFCAPIALLVVVNAKSAIVFAIVTCSVVEQLINEFSVPPDTTKRVIDIAIGWAEDGFLASFRIIWLFEAAWMSVEYKLVYLSC